MQPQLPSAEIRDPRDPDPVPSTKAVTALALAVVAVITAPFIGGVIPAVLALRLAGQAEAEIVASQGFLTGSARVRRGRWLAQLALLIAVAAVLLGLLLWLVSRIGVAGGGPAGNDFPSDVD
ncbi:hypothetical protein [Phytomonospora endophytica]|uniref:DUF4190 domain-containing protein n=1 Tax=Phytomonospora endophytica TaxID=714109 RepID=A0A841FZP4_9ACTN|nr:hypothetical protein [Phytomonospora endophytica]MBB6037400.1 hypothetical protein [Phytomonospora endophytica]GIG69858.1 hypothetical protein Pen01_61530 [Phytomonospora endophytica]